MGCGASNFRNPILLKFNQQKKIKDPMLFLEVFSTDFKEVKGLVINTEKTDFLQIKPISENNMIFQEEVLVYGDETNTLRPWEINIVPPNLKLEEDITPPEIELKPSHIFGYRCTDSRDNLFFLNEENIIYFTGAFAIIQNIKTKTQKIFGGNLKSSSDSSKDINNNDNQKGFSNKNMNNLHLKDNLNNQDCLITGDMCHTNDICAMTIFKGEVCMVATAQIDPRPYVLIWSPDDTNIIYAKFYLDYGSKAVRNLAFDWKGKCLLCMGHDEMNSFYVFNIQSKELIWKDVTGNEIIFDGQFSPMDNNEFCMIGVNSVYFCNLLTKEKVNLAKTVKKYKNLIFICMEFTKDGQKVITSTANGLLIIWTTNKENSLVIDLIEIKVSSFPILNLKISKASNLIYCTNSDKKIFLINTDTNSLEDDLEMDAIVKGIDVNSKDKLLLGLADGRIIIKNLKSERIREITYSHFSGKLRGLEFVPPNYILTSGQDNRVMLFNINNYKLEAFSLINEKAIKDHSKLNTLNIALNSEFALNHSSQCITYNKKYEHVAIGLDNGSISIRKSIKNLKLKFMEDLKIADQSVCSLKYSPNDKLLAVISEDEKLTFLKVEDNYAVVKLYNDLCGVPIELDWETTSNYVQVINSNGEYLIYNIYKGKILDYGSPELKDLNWITQNCKYGYSIQGIYRGITNDSFIRSVERSNNWNLFAIGNDENLLEIFNFPCISHNSKAKSYYGHCDPIEKIKFNLDDTKMITIGGPDKSIVIWDVIHTPYKNLLDKN